MLLSIHCTPFSFILRIMADTTLVRELSPELVEEARKATDEEKINALRQETQLVRQAQRDQLSANQQVHSNIANLNKQLTQLNQSVLDKEAQLDDLRRKMKTARIVSEAENPRVPLPELHETATRLAQELSETRTEVNVGEEALARLLLFKDRLERDVSKQIERGEKLHRDLVDTRRQVKNKSRQNRDLSTQNTQLEREISQLKSKISDMKSQAKSIDRHTARLEDKMKAYDKETKALHSTKYQSKQLVIDEVKLAEERDQWIAQLRSENEELTKRLLSMYGKSVFEEPAKPKKSVEEEAAEVEAELKASIPDVVRKATKKSDVHQATEQQLLEDFDKVLRETAAILAKQRK